MKFFIVCNFGNTLAMSIIFFIKMFKIWCIFQKWNKKLEKVFPFSGTCIWLGSCKFSQYWTRYLPSGVNVLTNTLRFQLTLGEIFSKSTSLKLMKKDAKTSLMEISHVLRRPSHVDCLPVFRNGASYRVVWGGFSQSLISETHWLWSSSLFSKCLKCDVDSRNEKKNQENFFRFSYTCIWLGSCKFSQYWTRYLPSAVNVLTNTLRFQLTLEDIFPNQLSSNWWKNMIKSLSWRLRKYWGHFHISAI